MGLTRNLKDPRIGVIGGTGRMGSWFANLLEGAGLKVFRAGRSTDITPAEIARQCDVTVISVPIADTVRVIQEIGPLIPEKGLFMDLTSIKAGPMKAMLRYSSAEVVGLHPLFGPDSAAGNSSLRVVICPGRGKQGVSWIRGVLQDAGFGVTIMSPEKHDDIMGLVQGVNHFSTLALALCISRSGIGLEDLLNCSTQTFTRRLDRIQSIMKQPSGLFGALLMENASAGRFMDQYQTAANELIQITRNNDIEMFGKMFEKLKEFFTVQDGD